MSERVSQSHLGTVSELLYGSGHELSEQEHYLLVMQQGISEKLDSYDLAKTLSYAQANISNPELLTDVRLHCAATALNGIEPLSRYGKEHNDRRKMRENNSRFSLALDVLKETDIGKQNGEHLLSLNTLSQQLIQLMYGNIKIEYKNGDQIDTQRHSTGIENNTRDNKSDKNRRTIVSKSLQVLDTINSRHPQITDKLEPPLIDQYLELASYRYAQYFNNDEPIRRVIQLADPSVNNIVYNLIQLRSEAKKEATKRAILDKIVEITAASSKEPSSDVKITTEKRLFGLISPRVIETPIQRPSLFDSRLSLIEDLMAPIDYYGQGRLEGLVNLMDFYPGFVAKVVSLYDEAERQSVWENYSSIVASVGFQNGSYRTNQIAMLESALRTFSTIAPTEVVASTREKVSQRLAKSKPA